MSIMASVNLEIQLQESLDLWSSVSMNWKIFHGLLKQVLKIKKNIFFLLDTLVKLNYYGKNFISVFF